MKFWLAAEGGAFFVLADDEEDGLLPCPPLAAEPNEPGVAGTCVSIDAPVLCCGFAAMSGEAGCTTAVLLLEELSCGAGALSLGEEDKEDIGFSG
jgi:hypothetical protein